MVTLKNILTMICHRSLCPRKIQINFPLVYMVIPTVFFKYALVGNNYPNLFCLEEARRWWLRVKCAEIEIVENIYNVCKQIINIKEN